MKLISSQPPKPQHTHTVRSERGWLLKRLRSRLFSTRVAWWLFVAVVAAFAISVFRLLRHALEANLQ